MNLERMVKIFNEIYARAQSIDKELKEIFQQLYEMEEELKRTRKGEKYVEDS